MASPQKRVGCFPSSPGEAREQPIRQDLDGGHPSPEKEKGRKLDIEKLVQFVKGDPGSCLELSNSI